MRDTVKAGESGIGLGLAFACIMRRLFSSSILIKRPSTTTA
jgi:hypothetical protein